MESVFLLVWALVGSFCFVRLVRALLLLLCCQSWRRAPDPG